MVQPDRLHKTMQWCIDEMGITCRITQAKIQTHTIFNIYSVTTDLIRLIS